MPVINFTPRPVRAGTCRVPSITPVSTTTTVAPPTIHEPRSLWEVVPGHRRYREVLRRREEPTRRRTGTVDLNYRTSNWFGTVPDGCRWDIGETSLQPVMS